MPSAVHAGLLRVWFRWCQGHLSPRCFQAQIQIQTHAGFQIQMQIGPEDDEEELKDAVMSDMADIFSKVCVC